jgi:hypothetical protein
MAQREEQESKPVPRDIESGELPETHLDREDERWSRTAQTHDWLLLLLMIAIYLFWAGIVYFLEPGIR